MTERPQIHADALPTLDRLSRYWFFQRKEAVASVSGYISSFSDQSSELFDSYTDLREQAARQHERNAALVQEGISLQADVHTTSAQLQQKTEQYTAAVRRYAEAAAQLKVAGNRIRALEELDVETTKRLTAATDEVRALLQLRDQTLLAINNLEGLVARQHEDLLARQEALDVLRHLHEDLGATHRGLKAHYDKISQAHLSLNERFDLVQRILSQPAPQNQGVVEFNRLIHAEYQSFAARESSLADEARATLDLLKIQRELAMITNFPAISGKTVLGIAGGFSSGKSAFINSFIEGRSVRLAEGINPVTVIPSYVVCSPRDRIRAYCANGGSIELGTNLYGALSHEYLTAFGFDLRLIMPSISVETPMRQDLFEHLCLIDTPGYNPGGGGVALSADRETASTFVGQCSAMIWVIGLDPAGTVTRSDIEFIRRTGLQGEALYIVLNKADLKHDEDIQEIMMRVADDLHFDGIEYAGICAYSSTLKRVYRSSGQSLEQFIRSHNRSRDVLYRLNKLVEEVFERYGTAILDDIQRAAARRKSFKQLKNHALESGGTDEYDRLNEVCQQIEATLDGADLGSLLAESARLSNAFKECIKIAIRNGLSA